MKAIRFQPMNHGRKKGMTLAQRQNRYHNSSVRLRGKSSRTTWTGLKLVQNHIAIIIAHAHNHYWSCHAPARVHSRYKQARLRWDKRMDRRAPVHYINKYSLHKVL